MTVDLNPGTDAFLGDKEGWLAFAEVAEPFKENPYWCAEHWSPGPVEGRNYAAAMYAIVIATTLMIPKNLVTAKARARWVARRTQLDKVCCQMGDERIAAIWAEIQSADERKAERDAQLLPNELQAIVDSAVTEEV